MARPKTIRQRVETVCSILQEHGIRYIDVMPDCNMRSSWSIILDDRLTVHIGPNHVSIQAELDDGTTWLSRHIYNQRGFLDVYEYAKKRIHRT